MYVWGAIGTMFFGKVDPENWGNIGLALITLVQVATYDDWANIMAQVIDVYPYAWIFLCIFHHHQCRDLTQHGHWRDCRCDDWRNGD